MTNPRLVLRRAIAAAERLDPGAARDATLVELGGVVARARSSSTAAVRAHAHDALKAALGASPRARVEEIVDALAALDDAFAPGIEGDPFEAIEPVVARSRLVASIGLLPLRPAPGVPFVPPGEDEQEPEELVEPSEEELLAAPLAPDSWFEEDAEIEPEEPDVDVGALLAEIDPHDRIVDFAAPPPPPVSLREGGEPIPRSRFLADVARSAFDTLSSFARDRELLPWARRTATEARALEQLDAIAATGDLATNELVAAWAEARDRPEPYATWAALVAIASYDGPESLRAARFVVEALEADQLGHARLAAEALAIAPHASIPRLASALLASARPAARAVGVELGARFGLVTANDLASHARDANAVVALAAMRGAELAGPSAEVLEALQDRTLHTSRAVAFAASRLAILWGDDAPFASIEASSLARERLGVHALDLLALRGDLGDRALFEACHAKLRPTPASFDAVARFGDPAATTFLTHFLADEDLGEGAERALATIVGDRVERRDRRSAAAWKRAASELGPGRFRRGEPWSTSLVARDVAAGREPRADLATSIDELRLRDRTLSAIDLARFSSEASDALLDLVARFP